MRQIHQFAIDKQTAVSSQGIEEDNIVEVGIVSHHLESLGVQRTKDEIRLPEIQVIHHFQDFILFTPYIVSL